ncbi:MAG: hypothetical protein LBU21_03125 [Treponema sp.]|jgi:hypothetical protein|nr:hypothetical protein [Treponema sp.]
MRYFVSLIIVCSLVVSSCASWPESHEEEVPVEAEPLMRDTPTETQAPAESRLPEPAPAADPPPAQPVFDFTAITEEVRNTTKLDIQALIGELNEIIRRGDFEAWTDRLDASYLERLSSREFLDTVSQNSKLKARGEPLKDLEDYFINVVIPSRADTRVDDIDIEFFPDEEKVMAFRPAPTGQRLRLYDLKNIDGTWKIIN